MSDTTAKRERFQQLHAGPDLFVLPNPYDVGTARLMADMGFQALATGSAGFARTLGRPDGRRAVSRSESIAHAVAINHASDLPVTADLEDGFDPAPAGVATTVAEAVAVGLAGCCIEDATYDPTSVIHSMAQAVDRIAAAVDAAAGTGFVVTARAENFLYGRPDLGDTIARLAAFVGAGADAVYAPGLTRLEDIRAVVESVPAPVNVLIGLPGQDFTVSDLAGIGVRRVSVGSGFSRAAFVAVFAAATELLEVGSNPVLGQDAPDVDAIFEQ